MATRRQKIAALVLGYLQDISVANGYNTALGVKTAHWDTQVEPTSNTIVANLKDTVNDHDAGPHKESLTLRIELSCKQSDNYTTLTNMIQDVHKALWDNRAALGAAINQPIKLMPVSENIEVMREGSAEIGSATVEVIIEHRFTSKYELDETNY